MLKGIGSLLAVLKKPFDEEPGLEIDFDREPSLPRDATRMVRHRSAAAGMRTITSGDLELVPFRRGTTYDEFYHLHADEPLADALILDAVISRIAADVSRADAIIRRFCGTFS